MKTLKTIFLVALLALPGIAFAGAPWTYVDLGLNTADSGDERTSGVGLRGSIGTNLFHAGLEVESNEWAGGKDKGGADEMGYALWVGLHPAMTDNVDLVLDLGYAGSEFETVSGSTTFKDDVTALFLRAGPRALLAGDKLELYGYLQLAFGDDKFSSSTSQDWTGVGYVVGGQFYFSPAWSLGAEAEINGGATPASQIVSADQLKVFLRWSFGSFGN